MNLADVAPFAYRFSHAGDHHDVHRDIVGPAVDVLHQRLDGLWLNFLFHERVAARGQGSL